VCLLNPRVQAENTLSLARAKLELLRLALDLRLAELPADSKMNRRDIVRQELETSSLSKPRSYQTLTKMAALSGQLSVRSCNELFLLLYDEQNVLLQGTCLLKNLAEALLEGSLFGVGE